MEVTGYPHCFQREEELCELYREKSEIDSCFRTAHAKAKADEVVGAQAEKFNKIEKKISNLRRITTNPSKTYWDIVETRLSPKYKAQLGLDLEAINRQLSRGRVKGTFTPGGDSLVVVKLFEPNGDFSKKGQSLLQESYDFVYGRSIGNKDALLESNTIIQAIQGTAAEQIRRIHSDSIRNIELIAADVAAIIEKEYPSVRTKVSRIPNRPSTAPASPSEYREQINRGNLRNQPDNSGKVF